MTDMTLQDVVAPVFRHATAHPDHPAFLFETRTLTYGEMADQSRRIATLLLESGVQRGDRVAVLSPNRPEIFSIYFGLALIGAGTLILSFLFMAEPLTLTGLAATGLVLIGVFLALRKPGGAGGLRTP